VIHDGRIQRGCRCRLERLARASPEAIPDYAFDVHTAAGRRNRATRRDFFKTEHAGLKPRQKGLFDQDVDRLQRTSSARRSPC
jgi:hypothetical protein